MVHVTVRSQRCILITIFAGVMLLVGLNAGAAQSNPGQAAGSNVSGLTQFPDRRSIDAIIDQAPLRGSHVGVLVTELSSGRTVYARNADQAFTPASTLKLVTGYTALSVLGAHKRFRTTVSFSGTRHGVTLDGDIIIRDEGDPVLQTAEVREAARKFADLGMRRVTGTVRVESALQPEESVPEGRLIEDLPYDYAAAAGPVALDENVVYVHVSPASAPGQPANIAWSPQAAFIAQLMGVRLTNAAATAAAGEDDTLAPMWSRLGMGVEGAIPMHATQRVIGIAVPDAARFLSAALIWELNVRGVTVMSTAAHSPTTAAQTFWTHNSPTVASLVQTMWTRSDNLIAEMLLNGIGVASGRKHPRETALQIETTGLAALNIDTSRLVLSDGSGLSRYSLMTPNAFAGLLRSLWLEPQRDLLLAGLPLAGQRGTLAHAFTDTPIAGNYYAKTGGMRNVANLSGVLRTPRFGWLSVTILCDDALIDDDDLRTLQTRILWAYLRK